MFRKIHISKDEMVNILVENESYSVAKNMSVAAALLSMGQQFNRFTAKSETPRGPFCMMGICFECLCEIDGVENQRACQTMVKQGMNVKFQQGVGKLKKGE